MRLLLSLTVGLVAVLALSAPVGAGSSQSMQVTATEFRFSLSRTVLRPGRVGIELVNIGEDDHDLRFRRVGGTLTRSFSPLRPTKMLTKSFTLGRGRYRLWCSLPGHRARGMSATLTVAAK